MAKQPTSTEPNADVMPEIDDDFEAPNDSAPVDAAADDDGPEVVEKRERPEDPREAAVRKFREMRAKEEAGTQDAADSVDDDDREDEEAAPVVAAPAAKPAAPAVEADEPTYTLIVDGKPVTMKASEVVAKAQIAVAADSRLDEAKALLKEARSLRGQPSNSDHQPGDDDGLNANDDRAPVDPAKANQPRQAVDKAKLKEIVQRLQIGDEDEGQQALTDLLEMVGSNAAKEEDLGRVVDERISRNSLKGEIQQATTAFRDKYPGIVQDQEMLGTSLIRLNAELRQDLAQVGVAQDQIAHLNGDQLIELHQNVRLKGGRVRPYQALLDKVGGDMVAKYGAVLPADPAKAPPRPAQPPANANSDRIAERVERKRSATPQPRPAGVRAVPDQPNKPKTKADIIAEMRRQRGFTA